ncbi:helix-turn-helix domain-containing protein [Flavobacterium sp. '19STA2R22 D10 B1']|uniref:helix-turn-helix domain-containing protein n=1 Tax=Flavobacterium aerium TaxID=3037261 RepID=UPI00278C5D21|nr:AraC family transcriptional regulator [Flavobacterium sp. '19STA2R22 D10 B1']
MDSSIKLISNYEYKKFFLPDVSEGALFNTSSLQVYAIQNYLKHILIPVKPYRTSFNFLMYIQKGSVKQHLDGLDYFVGENQILNIKQGTITATLELSDDAEGYMVIYENNIITNISINKHDYHFFNSSPHITVQEHSKDWLIKILELLKEELLTANNQLEIAITLFQAMLLKLIQTEKISKHSPVHSSRQLDIAFRFREMVQEHHIDHKNVNFYARKLNISENYLNKCIKEVSNKPPKQWINEISILHSQILLQDNSRDIAGIAFELNYQSPSYFTRLFKKLTGYSPTDYRLLKQQQSK